MLSVEKLEQLTKQITLYWIKLKDKQNKSELLDIINVKGDCLFKIITILITLFCYYLLIIKEGSIRN